MLKWLEYFCIIKLYIDYIIIDETELMEHFFKINRKHRSHIFSKEISNTITQIKIGINWSLLMPVNLRKHQLKMVYCNLFYFTSSEKINCCEWTHRTTEDTQYVVLYTSNFILNFPKYFSHQYFDYLRIYKLMTHPMLL